MEFAVNLLLGKLNSLSSSSPAVSGVREEEMDRRWVAASGYGGIILEVRVLSPLGAFKLMVLALPSVVLLEVPYSVLLAIVEEKKDKLLISLLEYWFLMQANDERCSKN